MVDHSYSTLLEQGVAAWNRWREEHPDIKPDLSRAYLFEADLSGINFKDVVLERACLIGANLKEANLTGANLSGVYASGANLQAANLKYADLNEANFSKANLAEADLAHAQATATDFTGVCLTGACLEGWQISPITLFDQVICQYLYLRSPHQERYPAEGEFGPEEFVRLLETLPQASSPSTGLVPMAAEETPSPTLALTATTPSSTPTSPRPLPWKVIIGLGIVALGGAAIAHLPFNRSRPATSSTTSPSATPFSTSELVCHEPSPLVIPDRDPDHEYKDGTRFYGRFGEKSPQDGRGIMTFPNGDRYSGEYKNGKRNGCGTFVFANGRRYTGQFKDDHFEGLGEWMLETGDRYVGQFQKSKCNGQGTFISIDGSSRSGIWQNGDLVGGNLSCNRGASNPSETIQGSNEKKRVSDD